MSADVSLLPSIPAWRAQGAYTFLNCLKLATYESELPVGRESSDEQMAAVRQKEFRLISFQRFSRFRMTPRAFLV
jgi:hypothetical protein